MAFLQNDFKRVQKDKADPALFEKGFRNLPKALKRLNFKQLRPGQTEIVHNILLGRDTLGLLPTGTGKTATFVIPTLALGFHTVIFSPLKALMKDQVDKLRKLGFSVGLINSDVSPSQKEAILRAWKQGKLDFLYLTPERVGTSECVEAFDTRKPDMIVIDEAHTIVQWGDNFRPSFTKIGQFIYDYDPKVVLALTATATNRAQNFIKHSLGIPDADTLAYMSERKNLRYITMGYEDDSLIRKLLEENPGPAIVYCATIRNVEEVTNVLQGSGGPKFAQAYHGEMSTSDRQSIQDAFLQDKVKCIVATKAFGMGVDKPNIRTIIHRDTVEAVYKTFQKIKDKNNHVFGTVRELAQAVNARFTWFKLPYIDSVLNTLDAYNVVVRDKAYEKTVKVLPVYDDESKLTKTQQKYLATIKLYGQASEGTPHKEIALSTLSKAMCVGEATVRMTLNKMAKLGLIDLIPPPTSKPLKILDTLKAVDFAFIEEQSKMDKKALDVVKRFVNAPDESKQKVAIKYLEEAIRNGS